MIKNIQMDNFLFNKGDSFPSLIPTIIKKELRKWMAEIFIVLPWISISIKFIHQQMHSLLNLTKV